MYSKESLERLRQRIDLGEVISSYVRMQKSGAFYKGLCPFHEEKTPSFMIQKGDSHYHCFGCGAHGDSITFLMQHVKMTFVESLEFLSDKFQIPLEKIDSSEEEKGPNKKRLKQALERAAAFYQVFLLHSEEGVEALEYLYGRDIDPAFIQQFNIGYAPQQGDMIYRLLKEERFSDEELLQAGLIRLGTGGRKKDFFSERIVFPIRDRLGSIIGFSARKFREGTFGGKYINTSETPLFKKSQVLFGLYYSRHRIAKEKKALIVEGQIDALRLIFSGFDYTIAGQGTAFGEGHIKELMHLGVHQVYLALDADPAGQEAAIKIGDLFQRQGVEVLCLSLPEGSDPDSFLREKGKEAFSRLLEEGVDYLTFYYQFLSQTHDMSSPSQKNEVVELIASRIRLWEHPVLVHESLKKLSKMAGLPQEMLGVGIPLVTRSIRKEIQKILPSPVDPDRILDMDLLRWVFLVAEPFPHLLQWIQQNISQEHFKDPACLRLFTVYSALSSEERKDWLVIASHLEREEEQQVLNELPQKKVNLQRAEECIAQTMEHMLKRRWMEIRAKMQEEILQKEALGLEEDVSTLMMQLAALNRNPPAIRLARAT